MSSNVLTFDHIRCKTRSMTTSELIGAEDAAAIVGITRVGLIKAAQEGRVPVAARIGQRNTLVFDRAAVEEWHARKLQEKRGGVCK